MKRYFLFLSILTIFFSVNGDHANAASKFMEGTFLGDKRYDVKKVLEPGGSDSNLCWAASVSNSLQLWQDLLVTHGVSIPPGTPNGQGNIGDNQLRSQEIFNVFSQYWPHEAFNATAAYQWYIQGEYDPAYNPYIAPGSITTQGGYWKNESLSFDMISEDVWLATENNDPNFLQSYLDMVIDSGWGLSATVNNWNNHCINIWGYEYDDTTNLISGLWISDSDNPYTDSNFLVNISWNDNLEWWQLDDPVFNEEAQARFEANPDAYDNLKGWAVAGLHPFYLSSIPEPSSTAGLCMGLVFWLSLARRKRAGI